MKPDDLQNNCGCASTVPMTFDVFSTLYLLPWNTALPSRKVCRAHTGMMKFWVVGIWRRIHVCMHSVLHLFTFHGSLIGYKTLVMIFFRCFGTACFRHLHGLGAPEDLFHMNLIFFLCLVFHSHNTVREHWILLSYTLTL